MLAGNANLDYALLKVKAISNVGPANPLRVLSADTELPVGLGLYLVHHPIGSIKKITQGCYVVASEVPNTPYASGAEFGHDCDSEKGSSGGAIFDHDGTLIGLHHDGFKKDNNCNPVDYVNKAVLIPRILKDLAIKKREQSNDDFLEVKKLLATLPKATVIPK